MVKCNTDFMVLNDTITNVTNIMLHKKPRIFYEIFSILNILILLLGMIGNILSIYAFSRKKMKTRKFNFYLLTLAVFKLIFCFILFVDYLVRFVHPNKIILHMLNKYLEIMIDYLVHTIDSYLAIIKLVVSIDRMYAIKHPLKKKAFITTIHAKPILAATFLIIFGLRIPGAILVSFYSNKMISIIYYSSISPLIFNVVPTILILILNSFLIKEVLNYFGNKSPEILRMTVRSSSEVSTGIQLSQVEGVLSFRRFTNRQDTKARVTHYLIIMLLSLWLVITTIPYYAFYGYYFIYRICAFFNSKDEEKALLNSFEIIGRYQLIATLFFNLNHCVNFLVYFRFYSRFRSCITNFFWSLFSKIKKLFCN